MIAEMWLMVKGNGGLLEDRKWTINSAESTATALISCDIILLSGLIIDSEERLLDIGI